jgi:hypothetical protein
MTPEQIKRNQIAMAALRRNKKKAIGEMRDSEGGRCCLCVIQDSAVAQGFKFPKKKWKSMESYPSPSLAKFMGWKMHKKKANPLLCGFPASYYNDGYICPQKTHKQIAKLFETEYPEIAPKKKVAKRRK